MISMIPFELYKNASPLFGFSLRSLQMPLNSGYFAFRPEDRHSLRGGGGPDLCQGQGRHHDRHHRPHHLNPRAHHRQRNVPQVCAQALAQKKK